MITCEITRLGTAHVHAFGAKGDGATDDSSAFQSAIDSLPNGGTVTIPATASGYRIAGLIAKANVRVVALPGTVLRPATNADLVSIKPGGSWTGGRLDVTGDFSSSVFVFDGANKYSMALARTMLSDIQVHADLGAGAGTAIDFKSFVANGDGNIWSVWVGNLYIRGCEYAIRMRRSGAANDNWINGNNFSNIWLGSPVYGLSQEEDVAGVQLDGNVFSDFQAQFGAGITSKGFLIKGRGNHIGCTFWDWGAGSAAVEFVSGSQYNSAEVRGLVVANQIVDNGTNNTVVRRYP